MPSPGSYVTSPSFASLSEIIKLEPENEPWCAGFAPSQGRRCHARTNARGRNAAMILLNEGTKDLRAGRSIDELLEDLAPHVLCTRFHQSQATSLANRWKQQVRTYLHSQPALAQSTRTERHLPQSTVPQSIEPSPERLASFPPQIRLPSRVEPASYPSYRPSNIVTPPVYLNGGNTRQTFIPSTTRNTGSRGVNPEDLDQRTLRRHSSVSSHPAVVAVPRPAQVQVSRQTRAVSAPIAVARVTDNTEDQESQIETSQVRRREVEGECGICLCDLQPSHRAVRHEESESSARRNHNNEAELSGDMLVWCKATCGVNFHKQCIDQWLQTAHAPTCPTCRSEWKH
ncbi:hypothetical protein N7493_000908 [Penicillium malachiteum]|uniref:RING-type domain-containing protein n=1 Tax=Penicillium malachiteum TaxID=1324776 RepID=A0AAD6HXT4_9EURO|nr:hypothetical protein N7493_000908 [Penicillium malachiteum]